MRNGKRWVRAAVATAVAWAAGTVASGASASLTDSEKGQIKGYVAAHELGTVSRLRALVARPDLSEAEAAEALATGMRGQPFSKALERYAHELLFGPSSQASRSTLAGPVVRALLARADEVHRAHAGDFARHLDADAATADELMRIHQFVEQHVARAAGDSRSGILPEALRAVAKAYREHVDAHAGVLAFRTPASGTAQRLRAQVAVTLVEVASEGLTREEIAASLGLAPTARGVFARTGALVDDGSRGIEARLQEVVRLLEAVPGALDGVSLVLVDKVSLGALRSRGALLAIRSSLGHLAPKREGLWPNVAAVNAPDQALVEAARAVSALAARRALERHPDLGEAAVRARARAWGKGEFSMLAPSLLAFSLDRDAASNPEAVPAHAIASAALSLLLLDAQRTVDLALARLLAGRPEPFEQLLLGLAIAARGAPSQAEGGIEVRLGRLVDGAHGLVTVPVTLERGQVKAFLLEGRAWEIERRDDGAVVAVKRDGKPATSAALSAASVPVVQGDRWAWSGGEIVRLGGKPRVAALADGRVVIAAAPSGRGWDAVQVQAPSGDHAVQATLRFEGDTGGGGLVVRASTGRATFAGVALLVECAQACEAKLVQLDGEGREAALAGPAPLGARPPAAGWPLRLSIVGDAVEASAGSVSLGVALQQPLQPGHAGAIVRPATRLELENLRVEAASRAQPAGGKRGKKR